MRFDLLTAEEAKEFTAFLPAVKKPWWTKSTVTANNGDTLISVVCDNSGSLMACYPTKANSVRIAIRDVIRDARETFVVNGYEFISLGKTKFGYVAVSKRLVTTSNFDVHGGVDYDKSTVKSFVTAFANCAK